MATCRRRASIHQDNLFCKSPFSTLSFPFTSATRAPFEGMFGALENKVREIWEAHLVVDHPAGVYSSNQYITRDK